MDGCGDALGGKSCMILAIVSSSSSSSSSQTTAFVRRVSSRGPAKRLFRNSEFQGQNINSPSSFYHRTMIPVQLTRLLKRDNGTHVVS